MTFPKILSILSQVYTLPPLRDHITVLQHHPYQIQKFTSPSSLAKRQIPVATLYWDGQGRIKAIFNLDINYIVVQILENAGVNLAQSVLTGLQRYVEYLEPEANIFTHAIWAAQLGLNWRENFQRPHGVVTMGVNLRMAPGFRRYRHVFFVVDVIRQWLAQSGYAVWIQRVPRADIVGQMEANVMEGRSITERETIGARSDAKFCNLPIQNWPFMLTPGKVDLLLAPLITC